MEHCKVVLEQIITDKALGEVEAIFVTKDGTPVAVEGNVSVKLDKNGWFDYTAGDHSQLLLKPEEFMEKHVAELLLANIESGG